MGVVSGAPLPALPSCPTVSVIIPARMAGRTLATAVASALAQEHVDEVVVAVAVDAKDDTATVAGRLAAQDPRVKVVVNEVGTTPAALNRATAAAGGEVLVRLDAHAELPPGYVSRAIDVLRATGAANVGGRQVPVGRTDFGRAVAAAMRSPLGAGGASYRTGTSAGPVETVYLGSYRREALDAVGGFHDEMVRNQDYELNERLRRAGYVVWFDPELAVRYEPRGDVVTLARQYFAYGRWRRVTARLHPGSLRPRQLAAPLLVLGLIGTLLIGLVTGHWWLPAMSVSGYVLVVALEGWRCRPVVSLAWRTALALVVMHLSWGVGFFIGPPSDAPDAARRRVDQP